MKKLIGILFAVTTLFMSISAQAEEKITVFAAASLTNAMQDIIKEYEADHQDTKITLTTASSSTLARQIEQGAPVDIFISADQKWMDYLIERKMVNNKETLLKNDLVLIASINFPLDHITIDKYTDWNSILPTDEKIALGDPDHVPAGIYAKESLTNLGAFEQLLPHMARASNVREALMLVEREEAVLGIVYSTDAKISQKVKTIATFPANTFTPIEYPITLINSDVEEAKEFYTYLKADHAKVIFQKYGFVTQ